LSFSFPGFRWFLLVSWFAETWKGNLDQILYHFITIFVVPELTLQEVSGKTDIGFQVPTFLDFHGFLPVATVEKPVETKMTKY